MTQPKAGRPAVVHLTSVHPRFDSRIFLKECRTLAQAGYGVTLVVADGRGPEQRDGVSIVDVGRPGGRVDRIMRCTARIFRQARAIDASVYHLHDPELIPVGLKLKKLGKTVIFDSHEDVPKQILTKPYLNAAARFATSKAYALYEKNSLRKFDAIVCATQYITDKFLRINPVSINVSNFPILDELTARDTPPATPTTQQVCYVGGLSAIRGMREIVQAISLVEHDARLALAGNFNEPGLEEALHKLPGWQKVDYHGWADRAGISSLLNASQAGLVTLHPTENYLDALPVKMFEYMSVGLPVIASDFPLWSEIINTHQCGICVDPLDPQAIADAIDQLLASPETASAMGRNGKSAVHNYFNWRIEGEKLLQLYDRLLEH